MWQVWILSDPLVDKCASRTLFSRVIFHMFRWACPLVCLWMEELFLDNGWKDLKINHRFVSGLLSDRG